MVSGFLVPKSLSFPECHISKSYSSELLLLTFLSFEIHLYYCNNPSLLTAEFRASCLDKPWLIWVFPGRGDDEELTINIHGQIFVFWVCLHKCPGVGLLSLWRSAFQHGCICLRPQNNVQVPVALLELTCLTWS